MRLVANEVCIDSMELVAVVLVWWEIDSLGMWVTFPPWRAHSHSQQGRSLVCTAA